MVNSPYLRAEATMSKSYEQIMQRRLASVVARITERSVAIVASAALVRRALTTLTLSKADTSLAPTEVSSAATVHAVPAATWMSATSPA